MSLLEIGEQAFKCVYRNEVRLFVATIAILLLVWIWLDAENGHYLQYARTHEHTTAERAETDALTFVSNADGSYGLQYQSREQDDDRFAWRTADEWMAILTAVLVVFTLFLGMFTAFLWLEARATLRKAHDDAERQAEEFASQLAVAKASADAAGRSAEALISAERPHLIMETLAITNLDGIATADDPRPLQLTYRLINHGRTPAWTGNILFKAHVSDVFWGGLPVGEPDYEGCHDNQHRFCVPPGVPLVTPAPFELAGLFMSPADARAIIEAQKHLYIIGKVTYVGMITKPSDRPYESRFAFSPHYEKGAFKYLKAVGDRPYWAYK